jgi:V/A-type H+/Na+-transporting ATPase subunit E
MKKALDTGEEKLQKICDALRRETLEPAELRAEQIIADAERHAEKIVHDAHQEGVRLMEDLREKMEREKAVFHSSLKQSAAKSVETLKQSIEKKLFDRELSRISQEGTSDPKWIAALLKAIVDAIEKEGIETDLSAIVPKAVGAKEVAKYLAREILEKFDGETLQLGEMAGGARVRIAGKRMELEVTDEEIKELLARCARKDFRTLIFEGEG